MSHIPNKSRYTASHKRLCPKAIQEMTLAKSVQATGNLFKKGLSVKICIMATALLLAGCGAKDTCLDYGGHYNDATGKCEK